MFYVHLFLKAMYRKRKKKINVVFPKICPHIRPAVQELKLQKVVASREMCRANAAQEVHTLRL